MATKTSQRSGGSGGLGQAARGLAGAAGKKAMSSALERLEGSTGRLKEYADNGGGSGLKAAVTGASELAEGKSPGQAAAKTGMTQLKDKVKDKAKNLFGGGGGSGGDFKVTNIVEDIDIPAPVRLVYDQWTQFADFPSLMKKVESVDQEEDEKLNWRAQILWSHRDWESTIDKQVPDSLIAWTSTGAKGHVDGTVMFRELGPELCRVLVVLEYHPQGFFEHTGNLWRAPGRRVRLELKHFRRHVMRQLVLHPDELEGWRGVIEDGEVVKDHETAVQEEQSQQDQDDDEDEREERDERGRGRDSRDPDDEGDEDEDEYDEDEDDDARDEYDEDDEDEYDEDEDDDARDEYDEDEYDEDDEDDEEEEDEEPSPPRRRPARAGSARRGGR